MASPRFQLPFSANLGFLWTDLSLPHAIHAAAAAGFEAVECHWPYDVAPSELTTALTQTGIPMLGLNTRRGDVNAGDNGLSKDKAAGDLEIIDWSTDERKKFRAIAVEAWYAFAEKSPLAKEALDSNLAYMKKIGLID